MKLKIVNDFKVGCDPEFAQIHGNGVLAKFVDSKPSYPGIGDDHGGWVGELRPDPSKSCWTVVNRLGLLVNALKGIPGKLRAGAVVDRNGQRLGLGGHVHLDVNPYDGVLGGVSSGRTGENHKLRIEALDRLTDLLEHLDILPRSESLYRRAYTEYGKFGAYRAQAQPGGVRTEYRTMASWLTSPSVAYAALTGAKLATVNPKGALGCLKREGGFKSLLNWISMFSAKDTDAARLEEKYLSKGHKFMVVDPEGDFRERWVEG